MSKFYRPGDSLDHCPECGCVGVEIMDIDLCGDDVTVRCECPRCEHTFIDVYKYHHTDSVWI